MEDQEEQQQSSEGISSGNNTVKRRNGRNHTKPQLVLCAFSDSEHNCTNSEKAETSCDIERRSTIVAKAARSSAFTDQASTKALDPRRAESVKFAAAFMSALTQRPRKGDDRQEIMRKRRERKRQVNRETARRKRVRDKQELEDLLNQSRTLESSIAKLKNENSALSGNLRDEMEKHSRYMAQLEQLRASLRSPPPPVLSMASAVPTAAAAPATTPCPDHDKFLRSLISLFTQTSTSTQIPPPLADFSAHAAPPATEASVPDSSNLLKVLISQLTQANVSENLDHADVQVPPVPAAASMHTRMRDATDASVHESGNFLKSLVSSLTQSQMNDTNRHLQGDVQVNHDILTRLQRQNEYQNSQQQLRSLAGWWEGNRIGTTEPALALAAPPAMLAPPAPVAAPFTSQDIIGRQQSSHQDTNDGSRQLQSIADLLAMITDLSSLSGRGEQQPPP